MSSANIPIDPCSDLPAILGGTAVRQGGPPEWPVTDAAIRAAFEELLRTCAWGRYHGPYVDALSARLAQLHGVTQVLLTSSGTSAVELALRGVPVGEGDEVVLSAYDFKANFTNIALLGATPVLVDIDPVTAQIRPDLLDAAISPRTKAILVSHLHGATVDMHAVRDIADRRGVAVIEDVCQMPLATIQGRVSGTAGDVGVLSFGGSKLLTAGRGGAVVTNSDSIAQRIRLYTERGNSAYPLSEMQAAVLLPQLEGFPARRGLRATAVAAVREGLAAMLGETGHRPLTLLDSGARGAASFVSTVDWGNPAPAPLPHKGGEETVPDYFKLGMWYDPAAMQGLSRERFCEALRAEGIPLDPGFRSLHLIHARRRFRAVGDLPAATRADSSLVVLHHPLLLAGAAGADQFLRALSKIRSHARAVSNRP